MEFIKQYLAQSISNASANLRLNSQQIEAIALFKELILKSDHLEDDLVKMKKVTEFSTLAIKLHEIYSSLTENYIDISTISEKFKQHSQQIAKDVNHLLYNANYTNFRMLFDKLKEDWNSEEINDPEKILNEELIIEDKSGGKSSFSLFEDKILKPIKPIDSFLNKLSENENQPDIDEYIGIMKINSGLSKENGFEILSGMHTIVLDSLNLIKEGILKADKETIESLRACLIVIAAVVRGKEVNISDYLNKAESFSKKISSIKSKEEK